MRQHFSTIPEAEAYLLSLGFSFTRHDYCMNRIYRNGKGAQAIAGILGQWDDERPVAVNAQVPPLRLVVNHRRSRRA